MLPNSPWIRQGRSPERRPESLKICARVDQLLILGMVIPPLIGNPHNGYIRPYYWVDDHPLWKSWEFKDSSNARKSFHTVKMPLTQVVGSHHISNKYHTHSNGSLDPSTYENGMGTEWVPLSPQGGPMSFLLPGITLDMLVKLDHANPKFSG